MQVAVDIVTGQTGPDGTLRLALQIWSEALRDPVLAAFVEKVYRRLRQTLVQIARAAQAHGGLPPGADPEAVGVVLFAMMPGYALQRILTGEPEPDLFKSGLRTLLAHATA
jgi:hypothetical protein